jgi:hypothetical protein
MNYAANRPVADPEEAAPTLLEIATEVEAVCRTAVSIYQEAQRAVFLYRQKILQPSTAQASPMPSKKAGCGSTNPELM